jgi:dCMP deaminase
MGRPLMAAVLYVTLFPCNECAKAIIQVGIKEIVYKDDFHGDQVIYQASRKMLQMAGVKIRKYEGKSLTITIK